jgi:hypothetical protein
VENFTVCNLDGMEATLLNTFLDFYCVNVLKVNSKLRVIASTTIIPFFFYRSFGKKKTHCGHT